ncbi:hypothetical protein ACGFIW_03795 [Micromonospora sp. NPDC048935]
MSLPRRAVLRPRAATTAPTTAVTRCSGPPRPARTQSASTPVSA